MLVVAYSRESAGRREDRVGYYRERLKEHPYWFLMGILIGIDKEGRPEIWAAMNIP